MSFESLLALPLIAQQNRCGGSTLGLAHHTLLAFAHYMPHLALCRSDSANLFPAPNLTIVELEPILRAPMSVAVRIGDDALAQKWVACMPGLIRQRSSARMEQPLLAHKRQCVLHRPLPHKPLSRAA